VRTRAVLTTIMLLALASCSDTSRGDRTLTVFAASSLGAAFGRIADSFEAANPGVHVVLNLGASDTLAVQIQSEGTADVFASASETWMDAVAQDPGVTDRADFATNRLAIVTPPDDPADISSIGDLAQPGIQLVVGAEGVPVGDYARRMLANAGISDAALANVVSNEEDNAGVVAKIAAGEADVGIVYTSDLSGAAGNDLRSVPVPSDVNVIATYPIATVDGRRTDLARAFIGYVLGDPGQRALATAGFGHAGG
jgi:molybdate transport system substrate-binding protein